MTRDLVVQAWEQGFDAGTRLLPASRNPYRIDTKFHEAWDEGWRKGGEPELEDAERNEFGA